MAAGLAITVSGCAASSSTLTPAVGTSTATATQETTLTTGGSVLELSESLPMVDPARLGTRVTVPRRAGLDVVGVLAMAANGDVLVTGANGGSLETAEPGRVGVLTAGETKIEWLTGKPAGFGKAAEIWLGDITADWVVWGQNVSPDQGDGEEAIYSLNRRTGARFRLAGPQLPGSSVQAGFTRPQIVGDRVVWEDIRGAKDTRRAIYSRALDGGGPKHVEALGAEFVTHDRCSDTSTETSVAYVDVRWGERSGAVRRLTFSADGTRKNEVLARIALPAWGQIVDLAPCGKDLAVTLSQRDAVADASNRGQLLLLDTSDPSTPAATPTLTLNVKGPGIADVAVNARYLVFSTFNGTWEGAQFIVERGTTPRLERLPKVSGMAHVLLADHHLFYNTAKGNGAYGTVAVLR